LLKIITPDSYRYSDPVIQEIRIASGRLVGSDLTSFIKRAGHQMTDVVRGLHFAPGEIPVHLLAVGATEFYGPNRNGDGFECQVCRDYHPTFVKYARFYRSHKNKDTKASYGIVKHSMYNETMKRIELICALNGSSAAAKANGGVLADREMEKLAQHKDIPVSMACRVPFDICSHCGNVAPKKINYCDEVMCKAGGLKNNIGTVLDDGSILHAKNTRPGFFDISHVLRGADRIAFVLGELEKAASTSVLSGAELAERIGLSMPYSVMVGEAPPQIAPQLKLAYQLAEMEQSQPVLTKRADTAVTFPANSRARLPEFFRALADETICLPVESFLALMLPGQEKTAELTEVVAAAVPGVYSRLLADPECETKLAQNPFRPAASCDQNLRFWACKQAESLSLRSQHFVQRQRLAAIRGEEPQPVADASGLVKTASSLPSADSLAKQYALYQLAFLNTFSERGGDLQLTATRCILQNHTVAA